MNNQAHVTLIENCEDMGSRNEWKHRKQLLTIKVLLGNNKMYENSQ